MTLSFLLIFTYPNLVPSHVDMAKILIVDDDPDICFVLKKLLERKGHEAVISLNGLEAMKWLERNPFDIVITDLLMPEMDGVELIMEMRLRYPDQNVIAISGGGRIDADTYLKMAKLIKVKHTFQKPVRADELLKAIDDLLSGKS